MQLNRSASVPNSKTPALTGSVAVARPRPAIVRNSGIVAGEAIALRPLTAANLQQFNGAIAQQPSAHPAPSMTSTALPTYAQATRGRVAMPAISEQLTQEQYTTRQISGSASDGCLLSLLCCPCVCLADAVFAAAFCCAICCCPKNLQN